MIKKFYPLLIITALLCSACSNTTSLSNNFLHKKTEIDPYCNIEDDSLEHFSPAEHDSLWNEIRAGYQLQDYYNPRMDKYITYFSSHQQYIDRVTARGDRYLHYIVSELDRRNMPMELALLPIIESAFDPFAYSHGRAAGLWQFIPSTGKAYGLNQDWWYDGRRDVVASTNAALDYLERLAKRFDDDYLLALAAYNAGGGNVNKAIRRNRKAGKPTDFWSLKLPKETRAYVPQLLALSRVIGTPEKHSITLNDIPNTPYFEQIDIESQIDLAQAANLASIEMEELQLLNPAYNRWATSPKGPHTLLIPSENAETFRQQLAELPASKRLSWEHYTIKSGDSLISIAAKYKTSVALLKDVNNLKGNTIRAGKTLLIPISAQPEQYYAHSAQQRLKSTQSSSRKPNRTKIEYRVKSGDSFWDISRKYGVGIRELAKWNGMAPNDPLKVDQKLVVWTKKSTSNSKPADTSVVRKVTYKVRNGDSLAKIAGKFNLSVSDIKRWNPTNGNKKYIQPGDSLKLYVDITEQHGSSKRLM